MAKKASKKTKIQITKPVAGLFLLPYNIGQEVELEEKQAAELIESGHAVKA